MSSYVAIPVEPTFSSIAGSPSAVTIFGADLDDPTSGNISLPFPFSFFGSAKTSFRVNLNGFIVFNQTLASGFPSNAQIPSTSSPNDMIAAWWDDLHTGPTGSVAYDVTPDGELVVQWTGVEHGSGNQSGESATFQIALHPSPDNGIELYYDRTTFASGSTPWTATIGVENATGTIGLNATGVGSPGTPADPNSNHQFPDTDFLLAYDSFPAATYTASAGASPYASITGLPGETLLWSGPTPSPADCGPCSNVTDDASATLPMPFPFSYFLVGAVSLTVDSNGFLSINGGGCGASPNLAAGNLGARGKIAPFWDDLAHVAPSSRTSTRVSGTPGSRVLVVQWENLSLRVANGSLCIDPGNRVSFQAVLSEGSNAIEFRYATPVPGTASYSASVGITGPVGPGYDATGAGASNASVPASGFQFDPCECGAMATFGPSCGPRIGSTGGPPSSPNPAFAIVETAAPPGSDAQLAIGLSNSFLSGTLPLPISLSDAFTYEPGCQIVVDLDIVLPAVPVGPTGTVTFPVPIPGGFPSCFGPVYFQAFDILWGVPLSQ
ncbi:MAG TPA: hypothetical protein VKF62_07560, partial [Planctomycetota bacterium]|nr:hypothetical protein [Planctomycetota bacterium]